MLFGTNWGIFFLPDIITKEQVFVKVRYTLCRKKLRFLNNKFTFHFFDA